MEISKELLIKDLKEFNSIDKLFLFFTSAQGDAEYCEEAKQCYKELKWNQSPFYDVINSFWITFSYAMHLRIIIKNMIHFQKNILKKTLMQEIE